MIRLTDSNYYEAGGAYGALFFQFPRVLMYGKQYKHLDSGAELAYMVLKDRLEYSLRNHWADRKGHTHFTFTNQELGNLFNCRNQRVVELEKESEITYLLMQRRMGFNPKTKKSEPNRLYLSEPDVKATDVYLHGEYAQKKSQAPATSGSVKIIPPQEIAQTPAISGSMKITLLRKSANEAGQILATSGNAKITHNLDKEQVSDTDRYNIDTQKLDLSTTNFSPAGIEQQNHNLVKYANDFLADEDSGLPVFLESETVQLLSSRCRTSQQMRCFIGIILNVRYKAEKDHWDIGVYIPLDDEELKPLIIETLRRHSNTLRSNGKHIKDAKNYLYGTTRNLFGIWWNKQTAREYAAKHPREQDADDEDFWDPNVFQKWYKDFLNGQTKPRS